MPSVRIQDNLQLPANTYVIRVKEIEAGRGELRPSMLLVMDPRGEKIPLPGEDTVEPTFGLPAMWRSEEHTSELQSLMRISYAVFCLNKKNSYIDHIKRLNIHMTYHKTTHQHKFTI